MLHCPVSSSYICTPCHVEQSSALKKYNNPELCVLFDFVLIFFSITIILPYLCLREIHTWTKSMRATSNFLFERLWILVLRSPTAHRNNANAAAEQFVFYLQVHLRLCTGHPNRSLFISSSADLLRNASKLTLSPVLRSEGTAACAPRLRSLFPFWQMDFEEHVWQVLSHIFFPISVYGKHFQLRFYRHKMFIHTYGNRCI